MKRSILSQIFLLSLSASAIHPLAWAEEVSVRATYLGLEKPSPFQAQLLVQVTNESFMSVPLLEKIRSSQLFVDGHPHQRSDTPFQGPGGLSPKTSWQGCVPLSDYVPGGLAAARHHLRLSIAGTPSKDIRINTPPRSPPGEALGERLRQAKALADLIHPGLLQSCVENWLPERDGGLPNPGQRRYYIDPGVKVLISYDEAVPEPRVKGRVRIYTEAKILD